MKQYGLSIPKKYVESVYPDPWMHRYLFIFEELSFDRPVGFSIAPIPTLVILQYCQLKGLTELDSRDVHDFVRVLDREYMVWVDKKNDTSKA